MFGYGDDIEIGASSYISCYRLCYSPHSYRLRLCYLVSVLSLSISSMVPGYSSSVIFFFSSCYRLCSYHSNSFRPCYLITFLLLFYAIPSFVPCYSSFFLFFCFLFLFLSDRLLFFSLIIASFLLPYLRSLSSLLIFFLFGAVLSFILSLFFFVILFLLLLTCIPFPLCNLISVLFYSLSGTYVIVHSFP